MNGQFYRNISGDSICQTESLVWVCCWFTEQKYNVTSELPMDHAVKLEQVR